MAEFSIVEADFQQYYTINLEHYLHTMKSTHKGFKRFARLLQNLPEQSRVMRRFNPLKDWDWDKEIQSQILLALNRLEAMYVNSHKKKGARAVKEPVQTQPDYVKKVKEEYEKNQKASKEITEDEMPDFEAFWKARNPYSHKAIGRNKDGQVITK